MVKVDCDPAQVIVNHASFRVRLAQSPRPARAFADTLRVPAVAGAVEPRGRRRAPVVWTGRSAPGDAGATGLLQAVRNSTATADRYDTGATQVIPRVDLDHGPSFDGSSYDGPDTAPTGCERAKSRSGSASAHGCRELSHFTMEPRSPPSK